MEQAAGTADDATTGRALGMQPKPALRRGGFTLVDLLMTMAALAVILFLILPGVAKRHARSSRVSCTNQLKQIGLAYRQWGIDNGDKFPAMVTTANGGAKEWIEAGMAYTSFLVVSNELHTPKLLVCPDEARKTIVTATTFDYASSHGIPLTNNHSVTYFVGLDADEAQPHTIVSGDDNFMVAGSKPRAGVLMLWTNSSVAWTKERHVNQGNIGLADGSVVGLNTPMLIKALVNTAIATNRLAMP
jgi:prepilin-type processing-associated H-X9-DG protein